MQMLSWDLTDESPAAVIDPSPAPVLTPVPVLFPGISLAPADALPAEISRNAYIWICKKT